MPSFPVDVLWIARYDYRPGWRTRLHQHNHFQMVFFLDGKGVFRIGDKEYPVRGGEVFLIRERQMHSLRAQSVMRSLDVKFRVAPGNLQRKLSRAANVVLWDEPGLATRFERIRAEGEQKGLYYRQVCSVLLTEILYLYLRQGPRSAQPRDAEATAESVAHDMVLDRAMAWIRAHYQEQLTIREIARAVGCTERTLRLHFQNGMKMRPLHFLQRYRITRGKALIQYSGYSLKQIAEQVGFQTIHHFTRMFTLIEGRSPAAWRRECLEGIRKDVYINPHFENRIFTVEGESDPQQPYD